jgi:hypothetical protein
MQKQFDLTEVKNLYLRLEPTLNLSTDRSSIFYRGLNYSQLCGKGALDGKKTFQEIEKMMTDSFDQRVKGYISTGAEEEASDLTA